jgi:hypothetical protein
MVSAVEPESDGSREVAPANAGRKQAKPGAFQPGQSGNPAGKKKGTRNRMTVALEKLLEDEAEEITKAAIAKAKAGDPIALRLVLERILPVRRGRPVRFEFTPINNADDVSTLLNDILKAVALGDLTPDEAATIASIGEARRKALETVEMERRLEALEADNDRRN